MTGLDRYVLRQILVPSLLAFLVIAFLAISIELNERSDKLLGEVLTLSDLARLSLYFLPSLVSYVVPLAFLFGILLGLGQLAAHGEITAITAGGISRRRISAPIIAAGAVLAALCMLTQDRVQPWAMQRAYDLIERELPGRATLDMLQPGVMHEYGDWRVYFAGKDPATHELYDVDVLRPDEQGAWVFHAEKAVFFERDGTRILRLNNGHFVTPDNLRSGFESQELRLPSQVVIPSAKRLRLGMSLSELLASEKLHALDLAKTDSHAHRIKLIKERQEIADRLGLPFAALAVGFVGAPLALRGAGARRGTRVQLFSSGLAVLLVYYLLRAVMEPRSLHDLNDYVMRAWLPNLVLIGIGAFLLWRLDGSRSAGK